MAGQERGGGWRLDNGHLGKKTLFLLFPHREKSSQKSGSHLNSSNSKKHFCHFICVFHFTILQNLIFLFFYIISIFQLRWSYLWIQSSGHLWKGPPCISYLRLPRPSCPRPRQSWHCTPSYPPSPQNNQRPHLHFVSLAFLNSSFMIWKMPFFYSGNYEKSSVPHIKDDDDTIIHFYFLNRFLFSPLS